MRPVHKDLHPRSAPAGGGCHQVQWRRRTLPAEQQPHQRVAGQVVGKLNDKVFGAEFSESAVTARLEPARRRSKPHTRQPSFAAERYLGELGMKGEQRASRRLKHNNLALGGAGVLQEVARNWRLNKCRACTRFVVTEAAIRHVDTHTAVGEIVDTGGRV